MTDKITLELTLDELKMLDKHLWISVATKPILEKIKNVYPPQKSPIEEAYKDWCGEYPSAGPSEDARWGAFLAGYQVTQPKAVPVDEPTKPVYDVIERLAKKYQAQKLYNQLKERGYQEEHCEEIVDLVEDWLPKPQSAEGSQNVDTELLVEGFNHCLDKIKEMLR